MISVFAVTCWYPSLLELWFIIFFWILEDPKENSRKSVDNKWCLCQTDFSYNNDNGLVLSNSMHTLSQSQNYTESTEINRQISSNQRCIWKHQQQISNRTHTHTHTHTKWTHNYGWTVSDVYKYPFYMFIKSRLVKYGIKVWVAADAKNFYAYNMQVYTGKTDGAREKQGLRVVKGTVCHTCGTGTGVNANNFLTSCELANLFLTRNMTLVGTLRANEPEIPALFLSGKQKEVSSSVFCFTSDLTQVSHVPARNKAVILHSSQHHDDRHGWGKRSKT